MWFRIALLLFLLSYASLQTKSRFVEYEYGSVTELLHSYNNSFYVKDQIKKNLTYISFVTDYHGNEFCVKQFDAIKGNCVPLLIREVLGSYIAESIGVRMNKVRFLLPEQDFPGKKYPNQLATLHTMVPGHNRRKFFPDDFHLEQYLKEKFPLKLRGLTRRVIRGMATHKDLPPIVAFDTFVSNPDRSNNNLFFDPKTKRYTGIDMELAYKLPLSRNLSKLACYHMERLLEEGEMTLSTAEIEGLTLYNKILKKLITNNPPKKIYTILKMLLIPLGLAEKKVMKGEIKITIHRRIRGHIKATKINIYKQYEDAQRLTQLVDQVIARVKKKYKGNTE